MLISYVLLITIIRAFRSPNDFAEAHWLLDYRFGFVKRGLIGEIISRATGIMDIPITEQLIFGLSTVFLFLYCIALLLISLRIVRKSAWSSSSVLAVMVFFSSPFIVMSAHLNGYYDNVVICLASLSIFLLFKGRMWLGALLFIPALLTHENAMLLGFPYFCLAWFVLNFVAQKRRLKMGDVGVMLLPVIVFLVISVNQETWKRQGFVESFTGYLSQYPYIEANVNNTVPVLIARSFYEYYTDQSLSFAERIISTSMYGLIFPTAIALLLHVQLAYRIRDLSRESLILAGAVFLPQVMHVIAWDTVRIWTYTILGTFFVLWIYSEVYVARGISTVGLLSIGALTVNAVIVTPLMDGVYDQFELRIRLLLYIPAIVGGALLLLKYPSSAVSPVGTDAMANQRVNTQFDRQMPV